MKSTLLLVSLATCVLALADSRAASAQAKPAPAAAKHETQAALKAEAKIAESEARKIALAEVPNGKIREHELEREKGTLVYSFDIKVPGKSGIEEVLVDAISGKIVAHEHETPALEKKEAADEAKARTAAKKKAPATP
jgi:uncharacterized membrane protein YkoI